MTENQRQSANRQHKSKNIQTHEGKQNNIKGHSHKDSSKHNEQHQRTSHTTTNITNHMTIERTPTIPQTQKDNHRNSKNILQIQAHDRTSKYFKITEEQHDIHITHKHT